MKQLVSIGWVARNKINPNHFGGHNANCKVYKSRNYALAARRGYRQTNEDVLKVWDIHEVFIEVSDEG